MNKPALKNGWQIVKRGDTWNVLNAVGGEFCQMVTPWNTPRSFADAEAVLNEMVECTLRGSPAYMLAFVGGRQMTEQYMRAVDAMTECEPGLDNRSACLNGDAL